MEQNKKTKLILLLCLIVSAVLLEALLVWAISPRGENFEEYDLEDPGCITQEEYDEIMANAETETYDNTTEYNTDESNMQQASDETNPVNYTILSTRRLTEEDLSGLSKEELRIARNEIYARHGHRRASSRRLRKRNPRAPVCVRTLLIQAHRERQYPV